MIIRNPPSAGWYWHPQHMATNSRYGGLYSGSGHCAHIWSVEEGKRERLMANSPFLGHFLEFADIAWIYFSPDQIFVICLRVAIRTACKCGQPCTGGPWGVSVGQGKRRWLLDDQEQAVFHLLMIQSCYRSFQISLSSIGIGGIVVIGE